jgi:hypothetical protein
VALQVLLLSDIACLPAWCHSAIDSWRRQTYGLRTPVNCW